MLTGASGAYLVAGGGRDGRDVSWFADHLDVIQEQLAALKVHLRDYKKARGRYPTNDEGLAALDNFESRFKARFRGPRWGGRDYEDGFCGGNGYHCRWFWQLVSRELREYRRKHGRAPRNADELRQTRVGDGVAFPFEDPAATFEVELAISKSGKLFLLGPAGVLSPWRLPYIYENRNARDPAAFADSPANGDWLRRYSVRVDEGVYVYSLGARSLAQEYRAI